MADILENIQIFAQLETDAKHDFQVFRDQLTDELKDYFDSIQATVEKSFTLGKIFSDKQLEYLH